MTTITPEYVLIDVEHAAQSLETACQNLDIATGEVVLDFSSVRRVDPQTLRALDVLARVAQDKAVKIVLRGVNVEVYKVFKLARLASRFSFVN